MLRSSARLFHQPLIRFTHAISKNGGKPFEWKSVASAAGASVSDVGSNLYDNFSDLPLRFRPRVMKEDEMEVIMMGGASPYELKKKKR